MRQHKSLPVLVLFIMLIITTGQVNAKTINVLVLGQYQGQYETVMVNLYQSGSTENRIISIPPGALFLDDALLSKDKIVNLLTDSGVSPVKAALAEYLALPLPYYIIVDYEGAQGVVDAMGGVYFNLPYPIKLPGDAGQPALELQVGPQLFDGETARRFLRYRQGDLHGPGEMQVIQLQQHFLDAMIQQLSREKRKIVPVALKLPKMIKTNIGLFDLLNLAYDAVKMDPDTLKVEYGVIPGQFIRVNGHYQYQIQEMRGYRLPE